MNDIQKQNQTSWNRIADEWFGATALPKYGCLMPDETELNLFGDVTGKRILDIGCSSGHSLLYHAHHGAGELWGLDLSSKQIENAKNLLRENGYSAKLFCSPMEANPHPFMHSISPKDEQYIVTGSYFDEELLTFEKSGEPMSLYNRKISTYINALYDAGFCLEKMIEETDAETMQYDAPFSPRYYAPGKAKRIPLSFIMKARKR